MNNPGRIHRAWWMLIGCCLLQGGSLGIVHNCRGIFYAPVIEDLGFGMGAFTFYVLFFGVCSCIVLPFVGTLFRRIDSRILLGGASLVFSGTVFAMGFFRTLPAFYIECLEPAEVLGELAEDMLGGCTMERGSKLFDLDWDRKYIHGGK